MTFETVRLAGFDLVPRPAKARPAPLPADVQALGLFGMQSHDIRSRPFNLMRSRLLKIARNEQWRLFGITSPAPAAGKSFMASNLAASLARTPDVEVYLFDFDLRRGSIAGYFGVEVEMGLESFLSGKIQDLHQVARRIGDQQLVLVPCKPSRASTGELIGGRAMKRLIDAMRDLPNNAICICDLPPVFANDDASAVSSLLDAFLMVIEEGVTTKRQVRDSLNLLAPATCAGTILNHHKSGLLDDSYGYGRKQSSVYASYYADS